MMTDLGRMHDDTDPAEQEPEPEEQEREPILPPALEGRKYDAGKPQMSLIPPLAERAAAEVLTFGARKYDPENWRKVPEARRRYLDAALRHINEYRSGHPTDSDSGLPALAHAIVSLMFVLELELEPKEPRSEPDQWPAGSEDEDTVKLLISLLERASNGEKTGFMAGNVDRIYGLCLSILHARQDLRDTLVFVGGYGWTSRSGGRFEITHCEGWE